MSDHPRALRSVDGPDALTDFDRRWLPGSLRLAANIVMREEPKEYGVARRLRLLADELESTDA